jgi:hypothetical protein
LRLDLGAEGAYLHAERVKSAINDIKSGAVVLSLSIDPLIKVLPVLMLSQVDAPWMLQDILHVGVGNRLAVGREDLRAGCIDELRMSSIVVSIDGVAG